MFILFGDVVGEFSLFTFSMLLTVLLTLFTSSFCVVVFFVT